jgi:type VI secretion system protein VasJ
VAAANAYLQANSALDDPWRWKLTQLVQWLPIAGPPPAQDGATRLPAPPQDSLSSWKSLIAKGLVAQALDSLESQTPLYPFWLDFHKLRVDCLLALGFEAAAEALRGEIRCFYSLWPSLRTLTFEDGTPFVSPETNQWLKETAADQEAEESGPLDLQALAAGDPTQGLTSLGNPAHRPTDGRGLMFVRIVESLLWFRLGRHDLALGLANWLVNQVEAHNLDSWEPKLAIEALKSAHEIYARLGPAQAERAQAAALRLALINPDPALDLPSHAKEEA